MVDLNSIQGGNQIHHKVTSAERWPFYVYLCGSMFCLLSSSICHLFSLPPHEPMASPNGLHRDHCHDHYVVLPPNLLHLPMPTPLANHLPFRNLYLWSLHHRHPTLSNSLLRKMPGISSHPLRVHGAIWAYPCYPWMCFKLVQPTKKLDSCL